MLPTILFYIFAFAAVVCGFLVVLNPFSRNPVTSAMFLVLTIVWLAGLFVLLQAFFLAAVQVLVYAGAVMVLFLFVIMLLDLRAEERRKIQVFSIAAGVIAVGAILFVLMQTLLHTPLAAGSETPLVQGGTRELGTLLFSRYLLPFEIVSLLLLVGMIGVILLSKKDLR